MSNLLLIAQVLLFVLIAVLLGGVLYGLRYVFEKMNFQARRRQLLIRYITFGLLFWLAFLGLLAYGGYFQDFQSLPPRILLAFGPPLVLIIVLMFSPSFGRVLKTIPPSWLIYIQSFRIGVELILWMGFLAKVVPFQMTFEGFNYDIIVGLTALMAGYVFFNRGRHLRFEAMIWNASGLALLIYILFIAVISTPSPFRVFMNEPANTIVAYFPFIWIPGFLVPFAFAMHLFSIRQLWLLGERRREFRLRK